MNRLFVALGCLGGCDPPICQPDPFVAIATSEVSLDADPFAAGIQATIRVRTSAPGELVTLEVFSATNDSLGASTTTADREGVAAFKNITLASPTSRLVASVDLACGSGSDELSIAVSPAECELRFDPAPDVSSFYAPAGILNALSDRDADTPGLQANITINTAPHARVELFDDEGSGDRSFAVFDADETGVVQTARTLADGPHSFLAVCTVDARGSISARIPIVVDSVAPTCELTTPVPGTTITPALDTDANLAGIQLVVSARVFGDDIIDEPTSLAVTEAGGSAVPVITSPIDAGGTATGSVTLDPAVTPATFSFAFGARDHAHNPCTTTTQFIVGD